FHGGSCAASFLSPSSKRTSIRRFSRSVRFCGDWVVSPWRLGFRSFHLFHPIGFVLFFFVRMASSVCDEHWFVLDLHMLPEGIRLESYHNKVLACSSKTDSDDESVFIKHRFSTSHIIKFVKTLSEPQNEFIKKYKLDSSLYKS
ncbi:hypothetical protein EJB05_22533, partial [Eragrostis curvula]